MKWAGNGNRRLVYVEVMGTLQIDLEGNVEDSGG